MDPSMSLSPRRLVQNTLTIPDFPPSPVISTMIFEPLIRHPLPSTDLLSYIFSDPDYNHDQPVWYPVRDFVVATALTDGPRRCMWTCTIRRAQSRITKLVLSSAN